MSEIRLTREEAIRRHRELWNKVADIINQKGLELYMSRSGTVHYERIKEDALIELGYKEDEFPLNSCWCCEYDEQFDGFCNFCPIKWKFGDCDGCESEYREFRKACYSMNVLDAIEWARIIANLPVKGE